MTRLLSPSLVPLSPQPLAAADPVVAGQGFT